MKNLMQSRQAPGYEEAVKRIQALQALDTEEVNPLSYTSLLTHGHKTSKAILLLHGYSNSPRQYVRLAEEFYGRGYNVFVPRIPRHGLKDRVTTALKDLTEQELLSYTREVLDILQGLGEQVTVLGCSMGGVLALWAAQQSADISLVCAISPALAYHVLPLALTPLVVQAFLRMPNRFRWWDEALKDAPVPPLHAYPRFATRGLAHITNIGLKVRALARRAEPKAGSVLVVVNPTDESVDNSHARQIVERWQALGAQNIRLYEFDPQLKLKHDLMDPDQPAQQVDVVYPILIELVMRPQ